MFWRHSATPPRFLCGKTILEVHSLANPWCLHRTKLFAAEVWQSFAKADYECGEIFLHDYSEEMKTLRGRGLTHFHANKLLMSIFAPRSHKSWQIFQKQFLLRKLSHVPLRTSIIQMNWKWLHAHGLRERSSSRPAFLTLHKQLREARRLCPTSTRSLRAWLSQRKREKFNISTNWFLAINNVNKTPRSVLRRKKTFSARRKYLLHAYVEFNGYLFIKKVISR